ncbi:hypothetical protein MTO96_003528 [Rhipicephalus appendiculatus]
MTSMATDHNQVKNSTLIMDDVAFGTSDLHLTTRQGTSCEDSSSPSRLPRTDTIENRTTSNENGTELAMLNTTLQMMARLLERQLGTPPGTSNDNVPLLITTTPDLTGTLPTYSGTESDNFAQWKTAVESMRERCAWTEAERCHRTTQGPRSRLAPHYRQPTK